MTADHVVRHEIERRRTFAIIAHPDAGKTTLTEKLLLYAGLLRTAGLVKDRKRSNQAASDWMGMEQERGISITASAMQYHYKGMVVNVLDTPGHQDFSEDTYRTLTAADCAVMMIDVAKGVEAQTRKLFAVCRLRGIPVLTFINKCDLPGRDPLDLLAEVEEVLGIQAYAWNWPVGSGQDFVGVVDRSQRELLHFTRTSSGGAQRAAVQRLPLDQAATACPDHDWASIHDSLALLDEAGNPYSDAAFRACAVTPVFFGSAMTNFGVEPFYDALIDIAPHPGRRPARMLEDDSEALIDPFTEPFSAYIFKIQANMDPRHRDIIAFARIVSGHFRRDQPVKHYHHGNLVRSVRLSRPNAMVACDRSTLDEAFPGDIVGFLGTGFAIGDTIADQGGFVFPPLPTFPAESFAQVSPRDLGKRKPFDKGLNQLAEEGTVQILRHFDNPLAPPMVAGVGRLQFDVLQYRLENEYGVATRLEPMRYTCSAWLEGDPQTFTRNADTLLCRDHRDRPVVLFSTAWDRDYTARQNPDHRLLELA